MTKRKANPKWPNCRPDIDTTVIVSRYQAGESGLSIAASFQCSVRTVFVRLAAAGIAPRPQGKAPKPRAADSATWKGAAVTGYQQLHRRVSAARGRPSHCEQCGSTDPGLTYDWANLTGKYEDPADYRRLCRRCHHQLDQNWRKRTRDAATGQFV